MSNTPNQMVAGSPLETLVVAELAEIRRREDTLQNHLAHGVDSHAGLSSNTFEDELAQLQTRADRLSRMMDAMSSFFAAPPADAFVSAHAV